jgi:ubiquitin C-terminal hydrolase
MSPLEVPYTLDIAEYMTDYAIASSPSTSYTLIGGITHEGTSIQGQYASFVDNASCWLCYDRNQTKVVDKEYALATLSGKQSNLTQGYVLFYSNERKVEYLLK